MTVKEAQQLLLSLIEINEDYLINHETDSIEFKNNFDWNDDRSVAKYLKFIASAANNKGGFLVFGINDEDKSIIGDKSFESFDIESITQKLNTFFSPNINIMLFTILIDEKICSVIYIEEFSSVPTICIKTFSTQTTVAPKPKVETILTKGDIYFRYPGSSEKIQPNDLIGLFHKSFAKQGVFKNIEQTEKYRKADLKPLFKFSGNPKSQDKISFEYSLVSEIIHVLKIIELKDNEYYILDDYYRRQFIQKGEIIKISTRHKTGKGYNDNAYFNIGVHIMDKDGRPYTMTISGRHQSGPTLDIIDGHFIE